jgi:hypothetical protein
MICIPNYSRFTLNLDGRRYHWRGTKLPSVLVHQDVAPGFKDKTRYTPYVSPESQITHMATNRDNINRQCLIYSVLNTKDITLNSRQRKDTLFFR